MHRSYVLQIAAVILFAYPSVASARQPPPGHRDPARNGGGASAQSKADALIRRGVELREAGNDEEALQSFRSAFALDPTARARAQIGLAEQALGHWVDAETDLTAALRDANNPWIAKNAKALRGSLETIQQHVGTLQIVGSPASAVVKVDDREVGLLPLDKGVRVSVGEIVVTVSAAGYIEITRKINVGPGIQREVVRLLAVAAPTMIPTVHSERPAPDGTPRDRETAPEGERGRSLGTAQRWGVATLVLGAAAGGVGGFFLSQAISKNRASSTGCMADRCDQDGFDLRRQALTAGNRATIAFIAAGALLAGGTTLLLAGHRREEATAWRVSPVVAPAPGGSEVALVAGTIF